MTSFCNTELWMAAALKTVTGIRQYNICDNYRISLQSVNITGIPYNIHNLSL